MAGSAREFFESLEGRPAPASIAGTRASYRFDVEGAGSWRVDLADGELTVAEAGEGGDCVIRLKENVLLRLLRGEQNPITAFMTGKITVDGDMTLALKLKDLF